MTGLILAFTGWAATITNQYDTPYCVAHAVATCGSFYGYESDPNVYVKELGLSDKGFDVYHLPNILYKLRVGQPKVYNREDAKKLISNGPVILNINSREVDIYKGELRNRHAVCAVGYNDNYLIIAQSKGEKRGYKGYGVIASGDIQYVTLQKIGSKTLTPSLITLTEKKENSLGSGQAVKSPTIKKRNTKKRFLKTLD